MPKKVSSPAGELQVQHICLMGNLGEKSVVFQQFPCQKPWFCSGSCKHTKMCMELGLRGRNCECATFVSPTTAATQRFQT